jgi:hypothetical protein
MTSSVEPELAAPLPAAPSEYVWRFRLDDGDDAVGYSDPLLELVRVQWEQLLRLTVPLFEGVEVKIDGFALMRDPSTCFEIFADDVARRPRT